MMTNFASGFPNANPFTPFPNFGNHTVQVPGGWQGANTAATNVNGAEEGHQVGPIRRGGGRFNNQRSGPYDRRPQNARFGANGRLTPPRTGMPPRMGGGGGKWGDGAGAQTVGPREAVQGRSLKSYEDLDAVAAATGGELNY